MEPEGFEKGQRVLSRDGKHVGTVRGFAHCQLEGCNGIRLITRWNDGKNTKPCSKGMLWNQKRKAWKIL
jgi:hypothetical protein